MKRWQVVGADEKILDAFLECGFEPFAVTERRYETAQSDYQVTYWLRRQINVEDKEPRGQDENT